MSNREYREATESEQQLAEYKAMGRAELDAMKTAFDALAPLSYGSRCRALKWLEARLDNRRYDEEPPF